jgi:biotin synthase
MLPCATLGHLTRGQLQSLKDAGLYRYHHNVETSRRFFPNICTTHDYDERLATLADAKSVGLSTCSCGIMGMGETMADRADMAFDLRDAGVDSLPVNFLMPIPGTPLEDANFMTPLEALKTIALFRFILPETEIRVCGGRIGALRELHPMIFSAGANGLLMGDYLTKAGRSFYDDERMLADLGLKLPGNKAI